uniref:Retrotransposon gag domain-containing protein n=1 Tax=Tanacetum cinerariifolium TaxID=118510 RepID=A0A699JTC7_TANCI|nr:hypothetical protein [Tanacetum cinerariifolium]
MPVTRQGTNDAMTPESIQAMIDQAIQRNSTHTQDNASQSLGGRLGRTVQPACVCSYTDFMKCQPLKFKGTEGIVGLSQGLKKMELVFHISGCAIDNQVKFATCTLLGAILTWWNSHVRTLGHEAAYAMTWGTLKKKMTDKYCTKAYTQRFQELALMCTKFLTDETEKVDKYISGLPDNIHGNVISARPKTPDETIELANDLMDQKLRTYAKRQTNNKRKADDSFRNSHGHQQQTPKRQNVARVYNMGTGERKPYNRNFPKNNGANPKGNGYFECGATGNFKRDCPKLENKDGGNVNAQGCVYAVGNAKKKRNASRDPDSNVITEENLSSQLSHVQKLNSTWQKDVRSFWHKISAKKEEDKSEGKQLKDVSIV